MIGPDNGDATDTRKERMYLQPLTIEVWWQLSTVSNNRRTWSQSKLTVKDSQVVSYGFQGQPGGGKANPEKGWGGSSPAHLHQHQLDPVQSQSSQLVI